MARLLMGAIVTKAAGKLNGHCFRHTGQTQLLTRLASKSGVSSIASNAAMPVIRDIFKRWNTLNKEDRDEWKRLALIYPINDRWGFPKYLTARQLFTKCNINTQLACQTDTPLAGFDGYIPGLEFSEIVINIIAAEVELRDEHFAPNTYLQVCCKKVSWSGMNPAPDKIKTIGYLFSNNYTPTELWNVFKNAGYHFEVSSFYAISISAVSTFGFKSPFLLYIAEAV